MKPAIYTCVTCRYSQEALEHNGRTGGEHLAWWIEHLATERQAAGRDPSVLQKIPFALCTTRCFMNCNRHCNVHVRAPGKMGYVIGQLPPTRTGAVAVLDFFARYLASADGRVAKHERPQAVRDGFLIRIPPWESDDGVGGGCAVVGPGLGAVR